MDSIAQARGRVVVSHSDTSCFKWVISKWRGFKPFGIVLKDICNMRRGIDRSGKTRHNLTYVKYVNPLYPLQRGKSPNTRDHLKDLNQQCNYGIGFNFEWEVGWRMKARLDMRFRNLVQQTDRISRWLSRAYMLRIKKWSGLQSGIKTGIVSITNYTPILRYIFSGALQTS